MKTLLVTFLCLMPLISYGQEPSNPLGNRWIVKTNVLSLVAKRPTISLERTFKNSFSIEGSYTQGKFNNILFTDQYKYKGFLLRGKKHFANLDYKFIIPYAGIYVGNLHRSIQTSGEIWDNVGFFGYPSRKFSGHSIRGGGTFGLSYFTASRINFDVQSSLGYGRYLNLDWSDPNTYSNGYPDVQLWASVGYCF